MDSPKVKKEKEVQEKTIKIIVPKGVRIETVRTEKETEIEILEKDWDKYSHIAKLVE